MTVSSPHVGEFYRGPEQKIYVCTYYHKDQGYWMTQVDQETKKILWKSGRTTCISERALGTNFKRVTL